MLTIHICGYYNIIIMLNITLLSMLFLLDGQMVKVPDRVICVPIVQVRKSSQANAWVVVDDRSELGLIGNQYLDVA